MKKISTGPQLSEYVRVVYEWNLLKIGFKNTYFQVFPGFAAIAETVAHIQPNGKFWPVFGQNGENDQKSAWKVFLANASRNCKVSEKSNEQFPRKSVTDVRKNLRTDERDS